MLLTSSLSASLSCKVYVVAAYLVALSGERVLDYDVEKRLDRYGQKNRVGNRAICRCANKREYVLIKRLREGFQCLM